MTSIAAILPGFLGRAATPARLALFAEFIRFGCVGLCGFVVDTAVVYSLRAQLGLYGAGMAAYVVAVTVTWGLNRLWTFRGRSRGPVHRQWALFLATNLVGFALNRGAYVILIATTEVARVYPVIAIFAGAVAGMFVNFTLSRKVVFKH